MLPHFCEAMNDHVMVEKYMLGLLQVLIIDSEPEVRSESLHAMPAIANKCDSKLFIETVIIPISTKLVTDPSVHVRASLAESICLISETVGSESSVDHLIPVIT